MQDFIIKIQKLKRKLIIVMIMQEKKFTLINIGPSRSATTSLFHMLQKCPYTAYLKFKELFNNSNFEEIIDDYLSFFENINSETRFLIDATTSYFNHFYIKYFIKIMEKEYINDVKYIHILRNSKDRLLSLIKFKCNKDDISYLKKHPEDKDIDENIFYLYFMSYSNLNILNAAEFLIGKENIIVVKIDDIEKIEDFCGLQFNDLELKHLNKSKFSEASYRLYDKLINNQAVIDYIELENKIIGDKYEIDLFS